VPLPFKEIVVERIVTGHATLVAPDVPLKILDSVQISVSANSFKRKFLKLLNNIYAVTSSHAPLSASPSLHSPHPQDQKHNTLTILGLPFGKSPSSSSTGLGKPLGLAGK